MTFQKMGSGTPAERFGGSRERRVGGRARRFVASVRPPKRRAITSGVDEAMVARPRASRDLMRSSCLWSPIPLRADVELRLDLRRADPGDVQSPLLPSEHDALAVGLDAALGGPLSAGAYDLAQKCDVEIWVAAAALRAVGGDAAAARMFIDECPGLLCTPGPDDDAVAPFRRADVVPAPRRKPPRRRGLSLPPQAM